MSLSVTKASDCETKSQKNQEKFNFHDFIVKRFDGRAAQSFVLFLFTKFRDVFVELLSLELRMKFVLWFVVRTMLLIKREYDSFFNCDVNWIASLIFITKLKT